MSLLLYNAAEKAMRRQLDRHPAHATFLMDVQDRYRRDEFAPWLAHAISDHSWHTSFDLVEAYAFSQVWGMIHLGMVGLCRIDVGTIPSADKEVEENQRALDEGLPEPFHALVQSNAGRGADDDGKFGWKRAVELDRVTITADGVERHTPWKCSRRKLQLEIGTTTAVRTLGHLLENIGLARWDYSSKEIIVMASHPSIDVHRGTAFV